MHSIYLHGFCSGPGSTKAQFFAQKLEALGASVDVPDLNLPRFENLSVRAQVEHVVALAQDHERVTLIGSSLGAYVAALAARQCERIQRLVLMAPAFRFLERHEKIKGEAYFKQWERDGYVKLEHYAYRETRPLSYGLVRELEDLPAAPFVLPASSLILHGLNDDTVPVAVAWELWESNPGSRLILFHSDHTLLDVLDELWSYVQAFLEV